MHDKIRNEDEIQIVANATVKAEVDFQKGGQYKVRLKGRSTPLFDEYALAYVTIGKKTLDWDINSKKSKYFELV